MSEKAQLQRRRATREPEQPLRAAEPRDQAEIDLGLPDLRRLARNADVARHR